GSGESGDGESEVADFDGAVGGEEAVGGFDIAVEDALVVGGLEAADDIENGIDCLAYGQGAVFVELVFERAAAGDFHGDDGLAVDFLASEDIEAIGVVDFGGEAAFAQEALAHFGIIELVAELFQGDAASGGEVFGFVDGSHTAASEQADDFVITKGGGDAGWSLPWEDGAEGDGLGFEGSGEEAGGAEVIGGGLGDGVSAAVTG
ncbi:MAG: hypothetical protein RI897_2817, partial [Verrucomicrobiota bacterium]